MDNVQGESLYTPRRVQKCLFGSGGSSRKKKVYKTRKADTLSGDESDLGPMSPLELSDQSPSSCSSSPNVSLLSPNITPQKLFISFDMHASWDQVPQSVCKKPLGDHTRMSLKKAIQAVKHSAQKEILPDSPTSLSNSPLNSSNKQTQNQTEIKDETVQETSPRQFGKELQNNIIETPRKSESPEDKLITPLTSENKMILLPRLHRRKSINLLDMIENSPERKKNTLKRHRVEELENTATKLLKIDENHSVPKVRAALFQEKDYELKLKTITLSAKTFYSVSETKKDCKLISKLVAQKYQRKSFTGHTSQHRRSLKRHTTEGINAGVSHNIKKPKSKSNLNTTNNDNTQNTMNVEEDLLKNEDVEREVPEISIERTPSPDIDPNKRFFKIKRSSKRNSSAVVTINKNVKLKVAADGKIVLNERNYQSIRQPHKKPKLADISFDATDLLVDEPELEATIEQNKVANILKMLEDDWADDDYDTMKILHNAKFGHISPLKPVAILNDVTMSPASELSNMTSTMNIKDISTPMVENSSLNNNKNSVNENISEEKYYPLFTKGYSANKMLNESNKKSTKENINWQLSAKLNGNDKQYLLDAGQKNFGATQCTECGVVYQVGDPEDENAHLNYHNNRGSLKFPGWKTERVIMEDSFTSSRVILVEPSNPKLCWKKVTQILAYVDRDLGLVDTKLSDYEQKKVYLYIKEKAIIGVLVAEHIMSAHRMIPELLELDCCTAESSPAKCGINVVWTDLNHRRQGIATKLVDILRAQFYFGYVMSLDDIAFSIPTPSGKIFAEKYTKTRNFKVYN
ncbi:PREDICTED: N-acetyltransferase ESCO1 [Habropoda laboriosa]|uniref:N-acetyltransferase ESCO1 n=1 Tax=Habropoda laboriosa TaxID=597456 RepID=UPI00083DB0CE|nr:PREDICTED: N-acetyltransferase ESCO1 [Habropoda laboriosa]